ncbi:MAG: BMP family ABC transporter substrate-binding protein, partial [Butyricicoccaceae bacterium]
MSSEEYSKALKLGRKSYRSSVMRGESPYLPVLERMLENAVIVSRESLGVVDIPLEQITGTYCTGRQPTFTHDFLPLMDESTEFARKWIHLCSEHLHAGIHDPIHAYEFMNRFYVVEGHKRVSVMKYFGAFSIRGSVTRLIPQLEDTEEGRIYREFLHFYQLTAINYLWFSREGGFDTLLKAVGKTDDTPWTEQERTAFRSFHAAFSRAFYEKSDHRLRLTVGDAMLIYLNIFDYPSSVNKTFSVISTELSRMWDEICNYDANENIQLILKPSERKSFFPSFSSKRLRIAFIHTKTASSSSW